MYLWCFGRAAIPVTLMTKRYVWGLLLVATAGFASSERLLPPDASVAGHSQSDLSQMWWQWAGSFESDDSPVFDRSGANCGLKQSGRVWFLAGTYGSSRVRRTCTVPRGRYLFFPLINYIVMPCSADAPCEKRPPCNDLVETAQDATDGPSLLILEIDGKRYSGLEQHRQATAGCFDPAALTPSAGAAFPSASNGYYALLAPLPPGAHVINFGGILPSLSQAVTYQLTVQ